MSAVYWSVSALLILSHPAFSQTTPPTPQVRTTPVYPVQAQEAGVEGDVRLRATIHPDGTVKEVHILEVPGTGVGLEDAVTTAVKTWQFNPAMRDGAAVEGDALLAVSFTLSLPGEYVFPATPAETWAAVKDVLKAMKFDTDKVDDTHQVLITKPKSYLGKTLPDGRALGLSDVAAPTRVSLYVSVSPDFQNARVSVGNVLEVRRGTELFTIYRNEPLSIWFRDRLGERLGRQPEALSARIDRRTAQSPQLATPGAARQCTASRETLSISDVKSLGGQPPVALIHVKPIFPKPELADHREGKVTLTGVVLEHGSLANIKVVEPERFPGFVNSAAGAASLWRFTPVRVSECPTPVRVTIEMSYQLR
jgi:TonB family protein